jgi:UDPglucose 6-dehydrogenase
LGKLGFPVALAIESKGHTVVAHDPAEDPHRWLRSRQPGFTEAGADELLARTRIELVSMTEMVSRSEIVMVTIQTPHDPRFEGSTRIPHETRDFDYAPLKKGVTQIAEAIEAAGGDRIVLLVSTVLPGTIRREIKPLLGPHARLCYSPLFISMGNAIRDFHEPEFVLCGVDDEGAAAEVERFYRTVTDAPMRKTTLEEAEVIKVLYNTFISTKIAFANTAMEICHHFPGANVDTVLGVLGGARERLISSRYFSAGMGDGGACHPRDNIALSHLTEELGLSFDWFRSVMQQREKQTEWLARLVQAHRGTREVVVLGRSFKPGTNIVTGSASVLLISLLEELGLPVRSWDPLVDVGVPPPSGHPFCYFIGTNHSEFRKFPFAPGSVVLDPWRYVEVPEGVELVPIGGGGPRRSPRVA